MKVSCSFCTDGWYTDTNYVSRRCDEGCDAGWIEETCTGCDQELPDNRFCEACQTHADDWLPLTEVHRDTDPDTGWERLVA